MKKKKIAFIVPKAPCRFIFDLRYFLKIINKSANALPLSITSLINQTDENRWEIAVLDENVGKIDLNKTFDLVVITAMSCNYPRAKEIARIFFNKGMPIICGGIHASLCPEEGETVFSSCVIGEIEDSWGQILKDAEAGQLKKKYICQKTSLLNEIDYFKVNKYIEYSKYAYYSVQTTRGCPFDCDFCSVREFNGKELRHRSIDGIINEVKNVYRPNEKVFFVDDNIIGDRKHATELFIRLAEINVLWDSQASVNIASDPALVKLAAEAGCEYLFLGIESVQSSSLLSFSKHVNNALLDKYSNILGVIRSEGIDIVGSFILGGDEDNKETFKQTIDFINQNHIVFAMINILTPFPGTKLFSRMQAEGRITDNNYANYDVQHVVFKPKNISAEELQQGIVYIYKQIYSFDSLYRRIKGLLSEYAFFPKRRRIKRPDQKIGNVFGIFTRFVVSLIFAGSLRMSLARIKFILYIFLLYFDGKIKDKSNIFYFMLLGINLNDFATDMIKYYDKQIETK